MKASLLVVALLAFPASVLADASLKSQIEAMNKPISSAIMKKDAAAFAKTVKGGVTPDFKYTDEGGQPMGFDAMVAGMKQGFAMYAKITKVSTQVVSVKESGTTGSAVEKHTMEGTMVGQDKKPHKMVFVGTSAETYKKVKGKWMMATMAMKTDKMTLDGKPMPMPSGGK